MRAPAARARTACGSRSFAGVAVTGSLPSATGGRGLAEPRQRAAHQILERQRPRASSATLAHAPPEPAAQCSPSRMSAATASSKRSERGSTPRARARPRRRGQALELVAQLDDQPLGGLAADRRAPRPARPGLLLADRARQRRGPQPRQHARARRLGPTPLTPISRSKSRQLLGSAKPNSMERVLAHDLARAQEHRLRLRAGSARARVASRRWTR